MTMIEATETGTAVEVRRTEAQLVEMAEGLAAASRSSRTLDAYRADWSVFANWCAERGVGPMPAATGTVVMFITDQLADLKVSTVSRRLVAINVAHDENGHDRPGQAVEVRRVMKGARRNAATVAAERGQRVTAQARELVKDDLMSVLPPLRSDRLVDIRDRALLLVGFAGAFRRSELEALTVGNMTVLDDCVRFHLPQTKTAQEDGQDREVCASESETSDPMAALLRWLEVADITDGPVFRSIKGRNGTTVSDAALSGRSVDRIVRNRCADAGLVGSYSAHSLRSGFATQGARNGHTALDIARAGGWADNSAVVARYIRSGERSGLKLL